MKVARLISAPLRSLGSAALALASRNVVAEHPIRSVQNRHCRPSSRVGLGQVAADQTRQLRVLAQRHRNDEEIGIERPDVSNAEQLEVHLFLRKVLERPQCGFSRNTKIPKG